MKKLFLLTTIFKIYFFKIQAEIIKKIIINGNSRVLMKQFKFMEILKLIKIFKKEI